MSTLAVAKKDFQDGIRSQSLLILVVVFAVFMAVSVYFFTVIVPPDEFGASPAGDPEAAAVLTALLVPTTVFLPIIGTIVGYKALVGERESGSLKFLLGLPHTRGDVVFGKLLGRSVTIAIAVGVGFAVGGVAFFALTDSVVVSDYVIFTGMALLLGIVFVSIAIAFSSAIRSATMATWGAVGLAMLFIFLWNVVIVLLEYVAKELSLIDAGAQSLPDWLLFIGFFNPTNAFAGALSTVIDMSSVVPRTTQPFYLDPWFGFVILAFWLVVPIGLAYLRFRRSDL